MGRTGAIALVPIALLFAACGGGTPQAPSESVVAVATPITVPSATASPLPTQSSGPTPIPTIPLAERPRTFVSRLYGYSIQYPINIVTGPYPIALIPGQADESGWDDIVDGDGEDEFVDRQDLLIRMRTRKRPAGVSFSTILASDIKFFEQAFDAKVKKQSKVSLWKYSGRLVTFIGHREDAKVLIQHVVVVTKTRMFQIYMFSLQGNETHDRQFFRNIFETFTPPK